jgi:hypothetical protein
MLSDISIESNGVYYKGDLKLLCFVDTMQNSETKDFKCGFSITHNQGFMCYEKDDKFIIKFNDLSEYIY